MIDIKFTNFFRFVIVPMTEEDVSRLDSGENLQAVLSQEQIMAIEKGMTNPYNGYRPKWSEIVAKYGASIIWAGDRAVPSYATGTRIRQAFETAS